MNIKTFYKYEQKRKEKSKIKHKTIKQLAVTFKKSRKIQRLQYLTPSAILVS